MYYEYAAETIFLKNGMQKYLLLAIAGILGVFARYGLGILVQRLNPGFFTLGFIRHQQSRLFCLRHGVGIQRTAVCDQ